MLFRSILRKMMVQKATEAVVSSDAAKDGKVQDSSVQVAIVEAVVNSAVDGAKKVVEKKTRKPRAKKSSTDNS